MTQRKWKSTIFWLMLLDSFINCFLPNMQTKTAKQKSVLSLYRHGIKINQCSAVHNPMFSKYVNA